MELIRHGNEKLQSKEQKIKVKKIEETERRLTGKLDTQKNYLKEHGNKNLLQMA